MSALPAAAARAPVEHEFAAARAWATRHGWSCSWNSETLMLRAATYHPAVGKLVELTAETESYRALPPIWKFVRPGTDDVEKAAFPSPGPVLGQSSIFHTNPVICAPWNRLAYTEHGGPHRDWGGPAGWLQVSGVTVARTIPDMLAVIDTHLHASPGFMA